ncbi:MAG: hypothetical protein H0X42_07550 [Solirubrobacterales bacterium]|nr:hypothetical protein [Solirubrobacterales bacterium]
MRTPRGLDEVDGKGTTFSRSCAAHELGFGGELSAKGVFSYDTPTTRELTPAGLRQGL